MIEIPERIFKRGIPLTVSEKEVDIIMHRLKKASVDLVMIREGIVLDQVPLRSSECRYQCVSDCLVSIELQVDRIRKVFKEALVERRREGGNHV